MRLFAKKPMYNYKSLERVRIYIDKVNSAFLDANPTLKSFDSKEYCELLLSLPILPSIQVMKILSSAISLQ